MPYEVDELVNEVRKAARATVDHLRKRWLRECAQLVLEARDAIEVLMPPRPEPEESGMATGVPHSAGDNLFVCTEKYGVRVCIVLAARVMRRLRKALFYRITYHHYVYTCTIS